MTETRASRFDRDWNHIKDTRKVRGWDYQANERKDRDFPAWAGETNPPVVGDTTVIPTTVTSEGKQRYREEENTGGRIPDDNGDYYVAFVSNAAGRSVKIKSTPQDTIVDYGFLVRINSVAEGFPAELKGSIAGIPPTSKGTSISGDWKVYGVPDEPFIQQNIDAYNQMGFEMEPIGFGFVSTVGTTVEIQFAD